METSGITFLVIFGIAFIIFIAYMIREAAGILQNKIPEHMNMLITAVEIFKNIVIPCIFMIIILKYVGSIWEADRVMSLEVTGEVIQINNGYVRLSDDGGRTIEIPDNITPSIGDIWTIEFIPGLDEEGIKYLKIHEAKIGETGVIIDKREGGGE